MRFTSSHSHLLISAKTIVRVTQQSTEEPSQQRPESELNKPEESDSDGSFDQSCFKVVSLGNEKPEDSDQIPSDYNIPETTDIGYTDEPDESRSTPENSDFWDEISSKLLSPAQHSLVKRLKEEQKGRKAQHLRINTSSRTLAVTGDFKQKGIEAPLIMGKLIGDGD